ncbi:MAG: ribosome biogenesis GTPase Der [Coriobacteriales bacterium]|jgi:GTP-binding protein|nr:ribosome biogenesis GTPase Der [Coriobacteriales bacterium]
MPKPIVAVVGRPNVGKSTFVNRITSGNEAIVHAQRGVTRDRSYHQADWNGRCFMLVDTGGIEMESTDALIAPIRNQALAAMQEADALIFLVDGAVQPTADDLALAKLLKHSERPVLLVVNKLDNPAAVEAIWEYCSLGLGQPWPLSSLHGHGSGDLLDALVALLPDPDDGEDREVEAINVAIIGRPNTGKSTLVNRLSDSERSIVSDVAGTTRDAVDILVTRGGQAYRLVDTAGMRRKSQIDQSVEYYGFVRTLRAIDRASVALLLIDASLGLTDQDQRVAALAAERGCALVILLNKWDLITDPEQRQQLLAHLADRLIFVEYAPRVLISALTGRNVEQIWAIIDTAYAHYSAHYPTSKLNAFLTKLREFGHTVSKGRMQLRINYVTQTGSCPPQFSFFANHPQLVDDNYRRYLENRLREYFDLEGTPVRLRFRHKARKQD